jgi:hypothetical protein
MSGRSLIFVLAHIVFIGGAIAIASLNSEPDQIIAAAFEVPR